MLIPVQPSPARQLGLGGMLALRTSSHLSPRTLPRGLSSTVAARAVIARRDGRDAGRSRSAGAAHGDRATRHLRRRRAIGRLAFEIDDDGPAAREIATARQRDRATSHRGSHRDDPHRRLPRPYAGARPVRSDPRQSPSTAPGTGGSRITRSRGAAPTSARCGCLARHDLVLTTNRFADAVAARNRLGKQNGSKLPYRSASACA